MRKRTFGTSLATLLSLSLLMSVMATTVLAKPGGIKVDSDNACESDREDNELSSTEVGAVYLWFNGTPTGTYTVTVYNHGTSGNGNSTVVFGPTSVTFSPICDGSYYIAGSTLDLSLLSNGTYTLVLTDSNADRVGGDSFRVTVSA